VKNVGKLGTLDARITSWTRFLDLTTCNTVTAAIYAACVGASVLQRSPAPEQTAYVGHIDRVHMLPDQSSADGEGARSLQRVGSCRRCTSDGGEERVENSHRLQSRGRRAASLSWLLFSFAPSLHHCIHLLDCQLWQGYDLHVNVSLRTLQPGRCLCRSPYVVLCVALHHHHPQGHSDGNVARATTSIQEAM
jgi:hypothetical protein